MALRPCGPDGNVERDGRHWSGRCAAGNRRLRSVGYFTDGKALPGRPEFEFEWDEHHYRFVSTAHRELFKADPARYAPQFSSYCAISLARGDVVEGNPEYWLISEGKLYLFGKPTGPAAFQQALTENVEKARQNAWLIEK